MAVNFSLYFEEENFDFVDPIKSWPESPAHFNSLQEKLLQVKAIDIMAGPSRPGRPLHRAKSSLDSLTSLDSEDLSNSPIDLGYCSPIIPSSPIEGPSSLWDKQLDKIEQSFDELSVCEPEPESKCQPKKLFDHVDRCDSGNFEADFHSVDGNPDLSSTDALYDDEIEGPKRLFAVSNGKLEEVVIGGKTATKSGGIYLPDSSSDSSLCDQEPRRRKVSFADEQGKELSSSVLIPHKDDIYNEDLFYKCDMYDIHIDSNNNADCEVLLAPCRDLKLKTHFADPMDNVDFTIQKLLRSNVALTEIHVHANYAIEGQVMVKDLKEEKHVFARFTSSDAESHFDIPAVYVESNEIDGVLYDTYLFRFEPPGEASSDSSGQYEFSVCYETESSVFWDNNESSNYSFETWFS